MRARNSEHRRTSVQRSVISQFSLIASGLKVIKINHSRLEFAEIMITSIESEHLDIYESVEKF